MPYSIAQEPEAVRSAAALQRMSAILSIRLIESTCKCKAPLVDNASAQLSFSAEFHPECIDVSGGMLRIGTRFLFRIIRESDKDEVISIGCLFGAEYVLAEGFVPADEQIKAFSEGPAIFNCWPYFREYAQNTVMRMNYPPPTIPFLWLESKQVTGPDDVSGTPDLPGKHQPARRKKKKKKRS